MELVLTDEPAHILAVRPGFAAEAWRVRGVTDWQQAAVEDLAAVQIGQRHLGRGHQVQVPIACDLEQVCLELRQVARALQRGRIHEKRRIDLGEAVLARVQVEHEVDQGAAQPGARAHQHGKPRTRHPCRAFEIQDP